MIALLNPTPVVGLLRVKFDMTQPGDHTRLERLRNRQQSCEKIVKALGRVTPHSIGWGWA